jgi:hypothetical protein
MLSPLLAAKPRLRDCTKPGGTHRVVLLGVESQEASGNQADTLVQEADEHIVLPRAFFEPHLALVAAEPAIAKVEAQAVPDATLVERAHSVGSGFAGKWVAGATAEEIAELLAQAPSIPRDLDAELLAAGRKVLPTRDKPWLSREVRKGFWERLKEGDDGTESGD